MLWAQLEFGAKNPLKNPNILGTIFEEANCGLDQRNAHPNTHIVALGESPELPNAYHENVRT